MKKNENTKSCPKTFNRTVTGYIFYHTQVKMFIIIIITSTSDGDGSEIDDNTDISDDDMRSPVSHDRAGRIVSLKADNASVIIHIYCLYSRRRFCICDFVCLSVYCLFVSLLFVCPCSERKTV